MNWRETMVREEIPGGSRNYYKIDVELYLFGISFQVSYNEEFPKWGVEKRVRRLTSNYRCNNLTKGNRRRTKMRKSAVLHPFVTGDELCLCIDWR